MEQIIKQMDKFPNLSKEFMEVYNSGSNHNMNTAHSESVPFFSNNCDIRVSLPPTNTPYK